MSTAFSYVHNKQQLISNSFFDKIFIVIFKVYYKEFLFTEFIVSLRLLIESE